MTRQRQPLKRSPLPDRTSAPLRKRAKPRKVSVLRDRGYLDWLRDECRCVVCVILKMCYRDRRCASGSMPIDPAHGPSAGMRLKGPDNEAIPLCRDHHNEQHQIGWPLFEAKYKFSREKEAATHYARWLIVKEGQA